jgi:acyl-coenzyme A synthetase/AMP-(fatty) acid ligase/3-hydroxymyristoyl/3-hydroxydecanoyl-(acyl carrier protein) dehydratase
MIPWRTSMADRRPLAALLDGFLDDAPAALTDHGPLSRREFRARAEAWRARFARQPGTRVGLYHEDSAEFAIRLFGAWAAGKQVHLPGDRLPASLARLGEDVDALAGELPGAIGLDDLSGAASPASVAAHPDDIALVLRTSGSTGEPVAIGKRLRQLDAEIAALEARFGAGLADAEVAGTVSHQHIYGLLFRVLWPLACGRPVRVRRLATPEQIAADTGTRPLVLVASPAHLKRLPETLDWAPFAARCVQVFSSGGPLPADASDAALRLWGRRPAEVLGSTETGGIASRLAPDAPWVPLPGVEWRLDGDRLVIRSPHLDAPDAWVETADRAEAHGDAFVLLGRADRIAKIEERRVSLDVIERRLATSPWIAAARVLVLPGDGERERVAIVAEVTPDGATRLNYAGRQAFVRDARGWLAGHVDPVAMPRRWRFVERMPVNAQGKTTIALLQALFRPAMPAPEWITRDAHAATLELVADENLAAFDGHFPGAPVLPGVAQLDWALKLGREAFAGAAAGIDTAPARIEQLKFQALVRPGTRLTLQLDWKADAHALTFRYTSAGGTHASGRFVFATGAAG